MFLLSTAFAQAAETAPAGPPPEPGMMAYLPMILIFIVIWYVMLRPQQKKMKEQEEMRNKLEKGEEVVTQAGIFGTITGITDKVVTLEIANNVRIKMLRNQISGVVRPDQPSGA